MSGVRTVARGPPSASPYLLAILPPRACPCPGRPKRFCGRALRDACGAGLSRWKPCKPVPRRLNKAVSHSGPRHRSRISLNGAGGHPCSSSRLPMNPMQRSTPAVAIANPMSRVHTRAVAVPARAIATPTATNFSPGNRRQTEPPSREDVPAGRTSLSGPRRKDLAIRTTMRMTMPLAPP